MNNCTTIGYQKSKASHLGRLPISNKPNNAPNIYEKRISKQDTQIFYVTIKCTLCPQKIVHQTVMHTRCSKCLPFARTHAQRRPRHSSVALSRMSVVWSMPCQICRKYCFSSQHVCYLQRIFNMNRKLKQQVRK